MEGEVTRPSETTWPVSRRYHVVLAISAITTAVASTWPVAVHLTDHVVDGAQIVNSRPANNFLAQNIGADVLQTTWILNWELRALLTQPLHLFEANIFYPSPRSLARAEHMFATSLLGAPGALFGGPVFAHQTALLLATALTAWSAGYVVMRWVGSLAGAVVAGFLFATCGSRHASIYHLQNQGTAYFPLILFGLERFGSTGMLRWAAFGAVALSLQILSGQHLGYYAMVTWAVAGGIAVFARLAAGRRGKRIARDAACLIVAGMVAAIIVLPFAMPYLQLSASGELPDNLTLLGDNVLALFSIQSPWNYLVGDQAARIPIATWLVGSVAAWMLVVRGRRERMLALMVILVGLVGALLSFGPRRSGLGLHHAAAAVLPGYRTVRLPARAIVMPQLALSLLAGCGVAELQRRRALLGWVAGAVLAAAQLWSWHNVVPLRPLPTYEELPEVYRFLTRCGAGDPLLELPVYTAWDHWREAERMFFSTYHWLPLLNGRGSYPPRDFGETMALAKRIPDPEASASLRQVTGVRWVLVSCDPDRLKGDSQATLLCRGARIMGVEGRPFGTARLYDLGPVPALPREWPRRRPVADSCLRDS